MSNLLIVLAIGYALGAATWPFVLALFKRLSRLGRKRRSRHYY